MFGVVISLGSLAIVRHERAGLPIMDTPSQLLKPSISRLAFDAMQRAFASKRSMLTCATDVDPSLYHEATVGLCTKSANYVRSAATLSSIDQSLTCGFESGDDDL